MATDTLQAVLTQEDCVQKECQLIEDIGNKAIGVKIKNAIYGIGYIKSVRGKTLNSLIAEVDFIGFIKNFSLQALVEGAFNKILEEDFITEWDKMMEQYKELALKLCELKNEAAIEARAQLKQDVKVKKETAKLQKHIEQVQLDFGKLVKEWADSEINNTYSFYYNLGWLVKHAGVVAAKVPDFLQEDFTKQFGADYTPGIIDSNKKNSSGTVALPVLSFKISLTGKDKKDAPEELSKITNATGSAINDVSFVGALIKKYGFKFGKAQDIDQIKATIPTEFVSAFDEGYNN